MKSLVLIKMFCSQVVIHASFARPRASTWLPAVLGNAENFTTKNVSLRSR